MNEQQRRTRNTLLRNLSNVIPPPLDYVCTGGSGPRCMNPVWPYDVYNELCHECMQVEILKLEENLDDVMTRLLRYRRAVK